MDVGQSADTAEPVEVGSDSSDSREAGARSGLRVLLAERRANAHSELSRRLSRLGHEVLARVTSGQAALDYAALLRPDVVLVAPVLEDTAGVLTALNVTRELPGIAAVVLTCHPAAADPAARPNWGAVGLVPADAEPSDLDAELRGAVGRARALAESDGFADGATAREAGDSEVTYAAPNGAAAADHMPSDLAIPQDADMAPPSQPAAEADPQVDAADDSPGDSAGDSTVMQPAVDGSGVAHLDVVLSTRGSTGVYLVDDGPASGYAAEGEVIRAATNVLVTRTGLPRSDVLRLMEQEAADLNQSLEAVARAVLGEDAPDSVSGEVTAVG